MSETRPVRSIPSVNMKPACDGGLESGPGLCPCRAHRAQRLL